MYCLSFVGGYHIRDFQIRKEYSTHSKKTNLCIRGLSLITSLQKSTFESPLQPTHPTTHTHTLFRTTPLGYVKTGAANFGFSKKRGVAVVFYSVCFFYQRQFFTLFFRLSFLFFRVLLGMFFSPGVFCSLPPYAFYDFSDSFLFFKAVFGVFLRIFLPFFFLRTPIF